MAKLLVLLPKIIKGVGEVFTKFKGLTIKQKVLAVTLTPASLWLVVWLIDRFGYENVQLAVKVLTELIDAF